MAVSYFDGAAGVVPALPRAGGKGAVVGCHPTRPSLLLTPHTHDSSSPPLPPQGHSSSGE
jgi:hypothetical protein